METQWAPEEGRALSEQAGVDVAQFSEIMARIYQGPLEDMPWAGALECIRRHLHSSYVTLILRPASRDRRGLMMNASESGLSPDEIAYNSYYYALDPFVGLPGDRVVTVDEVFGETGWVSSELYKQFLQPAGVRYVLGADLRTESGIECRFRVSRTPAEKDFSARDKAFCMLLLPHLKRAIEVHARLDTVAVERSMYANTVDRMQVGTVTLDVNGTIIDKNRAAEEILAQGNGLCIARGTIEATDAHENRNLNRMVRHAVMGHLGTAGPVVEAMPITRSHDKPRLGVLIRTIPLSDLSDDCKHRPAVALFLRDPERKPQGAQETLRKLFDFTPAETSLAILLANGMTLDEAADESGISKNTARTHLRAIFSKTGVTRQATLVGILLSSIVPMG
jgi:DNA-binding CsgD family transcriptional regulator/PAS domain-containing protein